MNILLLLHKFIVLTLLNTHIYDNKQKYLKEKCCIMGLEVVLNRQNRELAITHSASVSAWVN